jgi:lipopolysaccharide transport system ATP-binding protein
MSNDVVISVEGLGKKYRITHQAERQRYTALRDVLAQKFAAPFRTLRHLTSDLRSPASRPTSDLRPLTSVRVSHEDFWALKDVSFEVHKGEVVGIIGRNGAGKSTLLKILSRITEPTVGRVRIRGRVASLLEVGTGFHPELTGRENIFLNGAILGMTRVEIKKKFDEIVAFAEIEKFLDTPVKRYSSGMYVRLAFAVAAHLEPEILIVDEVLSVGDAEFQRKCLGKMEQVSEGGRTVLFVSHNMAVIQRLCSRSLFLDKGRATEDGPTGLVVQRYLTSECEDGLGRFDSTNRSGRGWARITDLRLLDENSRPTSARAADQDLVFEVGVQVQDRAEHAGTVKGLVIEVMFFDSEGIPITSVMNVDDPRVSLPSETTCRMQMCLPGPTFVPGRYHVNLFLGIPFVQHVDEIRNAFSFEITSPMVPWRPYELRPTRGRACRKAVWSWIQ